MSRFNATAPQAAPWRAPQAPPAPPRPNVVVLPPPGSIPIPSGPVAPGDSPIAPGHRQVADGIGQVARSTQQVAAKPKLNFGTIKKKEAAVVTGDYPVLPDPDGKLSEQAAAFLVAHAKEEAAKGAKEAARATLVAAARPFHFTTNSGHADVPSSVAIHSPEGEVRVTFKDSYKKLDEAKFDQVKNVIGESLAGVYIAQTFEFTIKSDKIPEAKMQAVIDAINVMAADLGIEDAVDVATCYMPTAEWHTARYRQLTPDQNLQLEHLVDSEKGFCACAVGPARGKAKG